MNYYNKIYPTAKEQRRFEEQIMSGESYNYADKKGDKHNKLDVDPPGKLDYPMRKEIKKGWDSPTDVEQYIWGKVDNKEDGYSKKEESIENIFEKYFK